jgi:DNA repair exonuclease SbcCD ATPase subunit
VVVVLAIAAAACGGSKGDASGSAEAKVDLSAMDQLKGLSADLQAQLDALMAPINEVDALVEQITSMPQRLNVNASALMGMAKATVDGGQVAISADFTADAAVRAEVEGVLGRLKAIVDGLKAIPENPKALAAKAAEAIVAVPALGAKVTAEANVKISNPFAKAEEKAQAQADIQSLAQVQSDVQGSIQQIQQKIMELPGLATSALAKLAAAFAV